MPMSPGGLTPPPALLTSSTALSVIVGCLFCALSGLVSVDYCCRLLFSSCTGSSRAWRPSVKVIFISGLPVIDSLLPMTAAPAAIDGHQGTLGRKRLRRNK